MNAPRSSMLAIHLLDAAGAIAQPVFVPDTNLRNAINAQVPGAVDASGYIDPVDPVVMNATGLFFFIDWAFPDLTGLTAFSGLDTLILQGTLPAQILGLPSFPDSLIDLQMNTHLYVPDLPPIPETLRSLTLDGVFLLDTLQGLPQSLELIRVLDCPHLYNIDSIPAGVKEIELEDLPSIDVLPALPIGARRVLLLNLPLIDAVSNWPSAPQELEVAYMPLSVSPPFPSRVDSLLVLQFLDFSVLPTLPDTCSVLSLSDMSISQIPDLPSVIDFLDLYSLPNVLCLPWLPNAMNDLQIQGMPSIDCLPNIPIGVDTSFLFNGYYTWPAPSLVCSVLTSPCPPMAATVSGLVYLDANANGQHDMGEAPYPLVDIDITPGTFSTGTNTNGSFQVGLQPGNYTLSCITSNPYIQSISPASHTATLAAISDVDSLNDFGIVLQPGIQDLTTALTASPAVPGFDNTVWLTYRNVGTIPMDGSVTFTAAAGQSVVSSSILPDVQAGNMLSWNFTSLAIGETRSISIQVNTDAGLPIGAVLTHSAVIDPIGSDGTPLDNTTTLTDLVVGSFDPNDKAVSPVEATATEVSAGLDLTYTIRFQNTGNWPAARVIITDTLSTDLDWSSFQFMASSRACSWYVQDGVAHFTFDPIYLPDSALDEPGSHGFVEFRIAPSSTLPNGAVVPNTANIYFDYNAPVITAPALFSVDNTVVVRPHQASDLRLWPNPTGSLLHLALPDQAGRQDYVVLDATGRPVLTGLGAGPLLVLDVTALAPGAYRILLTGDGSLQRSLTFVKQ